MKSFQEFQNLQEASTNASTDMEKWIAIAYNGGVADAKTLGKDWEKDQVAYNALEDKSVPERIVAEIHKKTGKGGKMYHYGSGKGKKISGWTGDPSATPKTDMYIVGKDVRISLKNSSGAQWMSGGKAEVNSTFNAVMDYYLEGDKTLVNQLMGQVEEKFGKFYTGMNVGDFSNLRTSLATGLGYKASTMKDVTDDDLESIVKGSEKNVGDYKKNKYIGKTKVNVGTAMRQWFLQEKAHKTVTKLLNDTFNESQQIRENFLYEAATGEYKFSPESPAKSSANWVLVFDIKTGASKMVQISTGPKGITPYIQSKSKKMAVYTRWKTGSSKTGYSWSALSLGTAAENLNEDIDNLFEDIDGMLTESFHNQNLSDMLLNEGKIADTMIAMLKSMFRKVMDKTIQVMKKYAALGFPMLIAFITKFFNVGMADIIVRLPGLVM